MDGVSIIIPHQNTRPNFLKEALDSVERQTQKPLEVIQVVGKDSVQDRINRGVGKAVGEYVLLLSDDDMLTPNFIEKTYSHAKATNSDIVSTFIDVFGIEEGRHGPDKFPFFSSLFRKKMFEAVGGFDNDMLQMADVDFWMRCINAGYKWEKLYEPTYLYRRHGPQDSATADWDLARERFISKHGYIV